jgi:VWFA-related protein
MPAPISVPSRILRRAACVLTLASFASAQSPPPPNPDSTAPTIQVYSRETIVDVLVTDAKGNPVRNLNQSDFTISEDGNPQPIRSFAEFGPNQSAPHNPPRLPPDVYTNFQATPATGPVNILLIDAMHCTPVDIVHSLRGAERYLLAMPSGTQIAIFWLAASGLHMLQGFTSNPVLLLRAVRTNRVDFGTDGDDRYTSDKITIDALNQIAAYVSPIKGRKNLLWFTPGMPVMLSRDGGYAFPDQMKMGLFGGNPQSPDMTEVHRLMDTYELFTVEQIAVSPINPIGVAGVGWAQLKSEQVAEDTGGEAFYNNNDLKPLIAQAIRDGSHFYTLSYIPPRQTEDGHYHRIKVETSIPGLHLVYRAGYNSEDPPPLPQNSGATLLKAAIEGKTPAATQLLFDVQAAPSAQPEKDSQPPQLPPATKTTVAYDVLFLLPQSQITFASDAEGIHNASFEFDLAAYDIHGKLVAAKTQAIEWPLTTPEYRQFVMTPFKLSQQIDLPPGQISLRVGVLDNTSNKVGTLEIPLTVAEIPKHATPPPPGTPTPCPPRCPLSPSH